MNRVQVLALCAVTAVLAACATGPEVRTRVAEQVDLASFHTYAFVPKPGTDTSAYKSITTQQLEKDVGEELQSRGYVPASAGQRPDLLVDFKVATHDRVEGAAFGPPFGGGWGWGWGWGPYGWGSPWGPWGWGGGYHSDVQTVTTVSLTIDLIERADKSVAWSGTAFSTLSRRILDHPAQSIDEAVHQIFVHFPVVPRH
ncbi:MAG: DUF4136 domain-containing protein [Steroidobacteraceae bacterium]